MGYTSRHLVPGEEIIYTGKVSKAIFIGSIICIIIGACLLVKAIVMPLADEFFVVVFAGVGGFLLLYGLLALINRLFVMLTSEFIITNKRCILKRGLLSITVSDIALDKCEGLVFKQGLFGRIFGYGRIGATTGGSDQTFGGLANPMEFRNRLFVAMEAAKSKNAPRS